MKRTIVLAGWFALTTLGNSSWVYAEGTLVGRVLDQGTNQPLAARLYIADKDGKFHLIPATQDRPVVHYDKTDKRIGPTETYSCIAPGEFRVNLPAGEYTITVERGKEYVPLEKKVTIQDNQSSEEQFLLERMCDLAALGWYSGDCHVHTPLADLPIAQQADDVNVAFPVTAWCFTNKTAPYMKQDPKGIVPGRYEAIDPTHGFWTLNSEYEIFKINDEGLTQGSLIILGHKQLLTTIGPPMKPAIEEARRQGAIIDLEKPIWPWSPMLVPVAGVDTCQIMNNSMWRQQTVHTYLWDRKPPPWIGEVKNGRDWMDYNLDSYYAWQNCGFNLPPSAGSANGVHPVPLGQSRVYVQLDGPFSYEKWVEGLRKGRSFVTCGPLLVMNVNNQPPGSRLAIKPGPNQRFRVEINLWSVNPLDRVEIMFNGQILRRMVTLQATGGDGRHHYEFIAYVPVQDSGYLSVRCYEVSTPTNLRLAQTGAVFLDNPERPVRPEPRQIQYFIDSMVDQIERNKGKLSPEALAEYQQALDFYRKMAEPKPNPTAESKSAP